MIQQPQWQNHKGFCSMDPKKQKMILLLTEGLHGKKLTEALPVLMEWKQTMERENIVFSPEENTILTEVFTENLTPAGRQQYEFIKPFLK